MSIGPTLTTARLVLRPPRHEDFDGFAAMAQEEDTMRFIGGPAPRDAAWPRSPAPGPCIVGRKWRGRVVEIEVNADERAMFDHSINAVRGLIDACKGIDPSVA